MNNVLNLIVYYRNRTSPLLQAVPRNLIIEGVRGDYVSLMRTVGAEPVFSALEKISTLERLKQKTLNLTPPVGLLEELEFIPTKLALKMSQLDFSNDDLGKRMNGNESRSKCSKFDLTSFESILLPTNGKLEDFKLDEGLLEVK